MMLGSNFETARILGDCVELRGNSPGFVGGELVARDVALKQGATVVHGSTEPGEKWTLAPLLSAAGLDAHKPALVVGTETYFTTGDDKVPRYVTLTWSQIIEFEQG